MPIMAMASRGLHGDFAGLILLKARLKDWHTDIRRETFDADAVHLQRQLPESRVAEAQARIESITRRRSSATRLD